MPQFAGIYYCMSQNDPSAQHPPLVLIHGAGASHLSWPAELRRLPGYTVYTVDLPGHGKSAGIGQHTIEGYADKVIDFLGNMGIYHAVLIGHSMGGAIALQAAYQYPNQVYALGLLASGAYMNVPSELIENLSNATMMPVALEWLRTNLFSLSTPEKIMLKTMHLLEQARPGVLYGDWQACSRFDLRFSIAKISAPAWVVAGAEDKITPVPYANFLASHLKTVRMYVLPGADHMFILEQPQSLVVSLRRFLADLEKKS
jgi:pimeloyl-ACP methyl ester carboxylesterase